MSKVLTNTNDGHYCIACRSQHKLNLIENVCGRSLIDATRYVRYGSNTERL